MKKPRAKVSQYKTVFKGQTFEVKRAVATMPSGKKEIFETMHRPPSVMILPINDKKQLLLIREYRSRIKKYIWALPAGKVKIKEGETPIRAAQRELREEAGVRAKKITLLRLAEGGQSWVWRRYAYIATKLVPDRLTKDEDEDIKVVPVSIDRAFEMIKKDEIYNENMAYMIFRLWAQRKKFGL
ncbi:MAG: NUDIX hydrolase [Candidatus Pacebacteria bacterium]|nr:NUDIX hydrolase [Candidatus Paceibacterota bacterium]